MPISTHRFRMAASGLLLIAMALPVLAESAAPLTPKRIEEIAQRAMRAFNTPGMAIGIVKDGRLVYAEGFGVRELGKPGRVTPDTVFQIGSNTKAFTAAALAILVDRGIVHWDDKVVDHLPRFRLSDPWVTREFTIRDLLSHRSGLGQGAGDLMFYPATDFSRAELIQGLRYLKPATSFRSGYAYDNVMYMVAGEIIPAVTGRSWEDFIEQEILHPLHMSACASTFERLGDRADFAQPHAVVEGATTPIPVESIPVIGPAGTINCNVSGLATWIATQLGNGQAPNAQRLFSAEQSREMWTVATAEAVAPEMQALLHTHLRGYGLGWQLQDEFGYLRVSHTGAVPGTSTWISMIPEQKLGVIVLTNQDDGLAMEAVGNQILDAYVGAPRRDLVAMLQAREADSDTSERELEIETKRMLDAAKPSPLPPEAYLGRFHDAWRGDAEVFRRGAGLGLKFSRTSKLEGDLLPYLGNTFVVRWADRKLNADAFVLFSQTFEGGVEGFTMRAISSATDFSFDFQDLDFVKVHE